MGTTKLIADNLPDKPSELIFIALHDLESAEKSKNYRVEMSNWHEPIEPNVCNVCLAGSVLAFTLKVPIHEYIDLDRLFEFESRQKLRALDSFRLGEVEDAFDQMGIHFDRAREYDVLIVDYSENPKRFKRQLTELANELKKEGY